MYDEAEITKRIVIPWSYHPAEYVDASGFTIDARQFENRIIGLPPNVDLRAGRLVGALTRPHTRVQLDKGDCFYLIDVNSKDTNYYGGSVGLTWGYGMVPSRNLTELPYHERFSNPTEPIGTWWDESKKSARIIGEQYPDSVLLALSGGIDSELMAWAFVESGTPFTAIIMRYLSISGRILNLHDISNAVSFCQETNTRYIFEDVPLVEDLINRRHLDYFAKNPFIIPGTMSHFHLLDRVREIGGVVVCSSDQTELRFNPLGELSVGYNSLDVGLAAPLYGDENNIPNIYSFFNYRPEQIVAYLSIPDVLTAKDVGYEFKYFISKTHGSNNLQTRRRKFNGFENVIRELNSLGFNYHEMKAELIDSYDWGRAPKSHYSYPASEVVTRQKFEVVCLNKMTGGDFMVSGVYPTDPALVFPDWYTPKHETLIC